MDNRDDIRDFLASRRAKISPEQSGLPVFGHSVEVAALKSGAAPCIRRSSPGSAILRATAGRNPYDRAPTDLVGELSTRSEELRTRWAADNVRLHRTGIKRIHHPIVGSLELTFGSLELPADPSLRITTYLTEPNSASADALNLLASRAATIDEVDRVDNAHALDDV